VPHSSLCLLNIYSCIVAEKRYKGFEVSQPLSVFPSREDELQAGWNLVGGLEFPVLWLMINFVLRFFVVMKFG
jgi:hypothetical protein